MPLPGIYPAPLSCQSAYLQYATTVRRVRPWRRAYSRGLSHMGFHAAAANCASSRHSILRLWRGPSPRAYSRGIISLGLLYRCSELCLFEALYPAPLARPFSKGLLAGDYLICAFMPLRRIVPLRGTPSCAFGAALLQGPTRGGLSHMDFYTAAASCASSRHSILRLWRGPSPRAYARGLSHMGFHATTGMRIDILIPHYSFFISFSDGVK